MPTAKATPEAREVNTFGNGPVDEGAKGTQNLPDKKNGEDSDGDFRRSTPSSQMKSSHSQPRMVTGHRVSCFAGYNLDLLKFLACDCVIL